MVRTHGEGLIQPTASLQDFFRERIESAIEKHQIDSDDNALWYLTQLLCTYSKTNRFLDDNGTSAALTPLAEYYRLALESSTVYERRQYLQRLGDVAIVIAGMFSGALNRKVVGVSYYISMGESAYGTLADESNHSTRNRALKSIFESLANNFSDYVVALSEIPHRENEAQNLLQMIDEWENTKHPALARKLRNQGVFLLDDTQVIH